MAERNNPWFVSTDKKIAKSISVRSEGELYYISATLAVAYEQRTANLIALHNGIQDPKVKTELYQEIIERLK